MEVKYCLFNLETNLFLDSKRTKQTQEEVAEFNKVSKIKSERGFVLEHRLVKDYNDAEVFDTKEQAVGYLKTYFSSISYTGFENDKIQKRHWTTREFFVLPEFNPSCKT